MEASRASRGPVQLALNQLALVPSWRSSPLPPTTAARAGSPPRPAAPVRSLAPPTACRRRPQARQRLPTPSNAFQRPPTPSVLRYANVFKMKPSHDQPVALKKAGGREKPAEAEEQQTLIPMDQTMRTVADVIAKKVREKTVRGGERRREKVKKRRDEMGGRKRRCEEVRGSVRR